MLCAFKMYITYTLHLWFIHEPFSFRKGSEAALIGHVTERREEPRQSRGSARGARPSTHRALP